MKRTPAPVNTALSVAVLTSIGMLIIPLPPTVLDMLLAFDIMFATAVLVVALSIQNPLELAAFPSLLLVTTLFRLSLDVSATRLILTQGDVSGGVGAVIPAFGAFVMRGNAIVGLLLFIILIVVQLVVVTNGAQRVAEVAARFTLDAMPGKQMAIDADLHTGLIDAAQARTRRKAVQAEADFYGAMDGAGKFVRGDAVAAIIIVIVNLVAGAAIGVASKHMALTAAVNTFSLLSIGNALATTLPAFLLSTAMGIMVTRAASDATLGDDLLRQLLAQPLALRTVGISMTALAFVPGLPHLAFGTLGTLSLVASAMSLRARNREEAERIAREEQHRRSEAHKPEHAITLLGIDVLKLDLGEDLLALLEPPAGPALLQRIALLRRSLALELGIVLPGVRVSDNLRLPPRGFVVKVRDRLAAEGKLHANRALAIGDPQALSKLPSEAITTEPALALESAWLPAAVGPGASPVVEGPTGTVVVDPIAVLTSTLGAVVRNNAADLLGRQEVQTLLDNLKQTQPAAVKGVVPEQISLGLVQRVLQHLVREQVSIRDIGSIVETIADESESCRDASLIGESTRRRLAPSICSSLADRSNMIRACALSLALESRLAAAVVLVERGPILGLEPAFATDFAAKLQRFRRDAGRRIAVVCSQSLRLPLARFVEALGADIAVLGLAEVVPGYTVNVLETISEN